MSLSFPAALVRRRSRELWPLTYRTTPRRQARVYHLGIFREKMSLQPVECKFLAIHTSSLEEVKRLMVA